MSRLPLLALLLAGCASSGIVPTDKGAYMVAKTSAGGAFGSPEELTADLYIEANAHCAKTNQTVETISTNPVGGVPFVRPARSSLNFRCINK